MTPGDLTTADLTKIAVTLIFVIVLGSLDDPRLWNCVKARWSNTIGAWFAKRRERIRIDNSPSEQCRRDINIGNWN